MKSLCRICLSDGAEYCIFGKDPTARDLYTKISNCLHEKVEDIDGYPRSICNTCNNTLQLISDFMEKYKQSCKILSNSLFIKSEMDIKLESVSVEYSELDNNTFEMINDYNDDDFNWTKSEKHSNEPFDPGKQMPRDQIEKLIKNTSVTIKKVCSKNKKKSDHPKRSKTWKAKSRNKHKKNNTTDRSKENNTNKHEKEQIDCKNQDAKTKASQLTNTKLCDICGIVLRLKSYQQHKLKVHLRNEVKCAQCDKTLCSDYYLQKHILRVHTKDKKYTCSKCDRSFAYVGEFNSHFKQVHVKPKTPREKTSRCTICNKAFANAKILLIHNRSVHTGERPAVCDHCGAAFYHDDYLKQHMRLHTGEAPFKCLVCGKGHTQRSNMKSHLRVHRLSELDPEVLKKLRPTMLKYFKKG